MDSVVGIILAAGASTRMGRPKQLLKIKDEYLLDHILKAAINSRLDSVLLVLGYLSEEIKAPLKIDLENPKLKIIKNNNWKTGISSSIIAGLRKVEKEYDHCMIILADMPNVTSDLINRLLSEYLASGMDLGAIKIGNRRSLPVILGRNYYPEIYKLKGDIGARNVFKKYSDQICFVNAGTDYKDIDIDSPNDYENYTNNHK